MLSGQALTTAMGILPHTNLSETQNLALSLDIPFWPQLPHFRFREDMYAQQVHPNPFVWLDEPGLEMIFNSLSAYTSEVAQVEYRALCVKFFIFKREG